MRRRTLVLGSTGAAALTFGLASLVGARARRLPELPNEVCSAAQAGPRPVALGVLPAQLSFAGTRLFKEAFLDEMALEVPRHGGRPLVVEGGGCDDGIAAVRVQRRHIGGLCCPLEGTGAAGWEHVCVGWDAKAVVAHPSLPVRGLRRDDLQKIVSGRVSNWRELGGPDLPVVLVINDHCPEFLEPMRQQLLAGRSPWSAHALMTKTDQKQLDTVMRFEHAVGINSWILAEPLVAAGRMKVLPVEGRVPATRGAMDPRYPLLGPMNMVFREWVPDLMDPFFDFLFSATGRRIVSRRMLAASAREAQWPRPSRRLAA